MVYFTLENAGTEKTLAEWGVDDFSLTIANQAVDTCDLFQKGRRYDAAYLFAFQSTVVLRAERSRAADGSFTGGYILFTGLVQYPKSFATPRSQSQQCTLVGPGWYFQERGFEQEYREVETLVNGVPTYKVPNPTRSRIFLNLKLGEYGQLTPEKLTLGEQLKEIVDWVLKPFVAAAAPAPFQYDAAELLSLEQDLPVDEIKNVTCAEAARKMYRWIPDAVQWFDYTTTPPTFHVARRANLAVHNLDVRVTRPTRIDIFPRLDLARPYVKIQFEITDSLNGAILQRTVEDIYPNPIPADPLHQFGGVPFVIDLRGYTRVTAPSVTIETTPIDVASKDWWLLNEPEYKRALADGRVTDITFDFSSVEIETEGETWLNLPRQLLRGQPSDAINAQWQRCKATIKASVTYANGSVMPDKTFAFQFTATNATSGTYGGGSSFDEGDPIPVGLAQTFYTAINALQHEGSLSFTERSFASLPKLGQTLKLIGNANAEHASMNALIQRVTQTSRSRTVEIGPPPHLEVGDLVALLRVTRNRDPQNPYSIRVGGNAGGGSGSGLRSVSAIHNSSNASGNAKKLVASGAPNPAAEDVDDEDKGKIELDGPGKKVVITGAPTDGQVNLAIGAVAGSAQGKVIELRWTEGCDENGVKQYALLLRSPWQPELPAGASTD